jgi:hypothetical protein
MLILWNIILPEGAPEDIPLPQTGTTGEAYISTFNVNTSVRPTRRNTERQDNIMPIILSGEL